MPGPVVRLLAKRDRIEAAFRQRFDPRWKVIQEELGIPQDLRSADPPRITLQGDQLVFVVPVRVPASGWQAGRTGQMQVSVPAEAAEAEPEDLRAFLRREWPLRCSRCGLSHSAGIGMCTSIASCWGKLCWRPEAPAPSFYVEEAGGYGYFPHGPQPRGLRYAIDLSDQTLFGIQITLRHSDHWITHPTQETVLSILDRLNNSVATDLTAALRGAVTTYANAACFSFTGPAWCPTSAPRLRLQVRKPDELLLSA